MPHPIKIRLKFLLQRVWLKDDIPGQSNIATGHSIFVGRAIEINLPIIGVACDLVTDLMRKSSPEKPKIAPTVKRTLAELVTNLNPALPDAHTENVCAREIRERDLIFRCICCVFRDRKGSFPFVLEQSFDWLIFDNRDTRDQ
jgi:hypothetical protein